MLRGRHEVWRRLLSINSRQVRDMLPYKVPAIAPSTNLQSCPASCLPPCAP